MKKCEWKDGKFRTCDNFDGEIMTGFYSTDEENSMIIPFSQCKQCGADIRKPEPEVIIKKSGGTWVARFDGVDYLCLSSTKNAELIFKSEIKYLEDHPEWNGGYWKPISEIEITDDIAKLRPMIIDPDNDLYELLAVKSGVFIWDRGYDYHDKFRLATVSDLEDINE